jgi:YidC/Oxa1 family membrane protein insertase
MNFDRNTIFGFIILAILFFGFFWYNNQEQIKLEKQKVEKARKDSLDRANNQPVNIPVKLDTADTANRHQPVTVDSSRIFYQAASGQQKLTTVENDVIKIVFTNKGGQPRSVELKKFKAPDSSNVELAATAFDKIDYRIITGANQQDSITNFYFSGGQVVKNADSSQTVSFRLQHSDGKFIEHQYVIRPDEYMVHFNINLNGANELFSNGSLILNWNNKALQLQKDLDYEKAQSRVCFNMDNEYDYYMITSRTHKDFNDPVKWVAVKQQFFNTALVAREGNFTSGAMNWIAPEEGETVVQASTNLKYQLPSSQQTSIPLGLYYGPTDYKTLARYGNDMEDMVNLGEGIFSFVKYINRWIVIPIFDLFSKVTTNFGIVIVLLTLFIRLLISPLTYKSYLSGAKMKVLRPEIEQLKAKYGGDQQQMSMEQMKLFREGGVNPLGGCIPALLQIPIFFALYSFFNSNVALRGQPFLWADDLSQYDSIASLPFEIPFFGDPLSLFTIMAVITSFLISIYSMSMTPDQNNPVIKYMPYFFPVVLLFVFNSLPSGLTWYYTVSNIITLALQFVIQNYIINHDKILAKIEVNRKKPKKQSKWQERLEQMQEQQKKMKDMQNKNRR